MNDVPLSPPRSSKRGAVLSGAGLASSALLALLAALPTQFALGQPGPTFDTLGDIGGVPLVVIDGAMQHESTGELRLTTVAVTRGSDSFFTMGRIVQGWLTSYEYVVPQEVVFGRPEDREAYQQVTQQQWITSQETATVAALEALGMEVPADMEVVDIGDDSNARGLLEIGDRIRALDGLSMDSYGDLVRHMDAVSPGADVAVTVIRAGQELTVEFATTEGDNGAALMGIFIDPHFDLPVDVTVALDTVGGPSAGLMFSLAIMELLTEGDALQGVSIAGTGGITIEGDVEAMGGLVQKVRAAAEQGADYFMLPEQNCSDVVGHIPHGLVVIPVSRLDEAFEAMVDAGAGRIDQLPRCDVANTSVN